MEKTWDKCLREIRKEVKPQLYKTMFKDLKVVSIDSGVLKLKAKDRIVKEYLEKNYLNVIKEVVSKEFGRQLDVAIVLAEDIHKPLQLELNLFEVKKRKENLESNLNPKYTFENFVVGANNQFAHAAAVAVAENPGKAYNPLFIYGGVGLGKTHLMQAIGNFIKNVSPSKTVVYITTESFMNELIDALKNDKMTEFREKYRTVDVLLIDDIQFISGKDGTQIEFFHTFNALYDAGKQVVLTSDRPPKDIPMLTERLRSRFEWGLIADIQPPDFETRIAILRRKAEAEGIEVEDSILKLIANIIKSNIRQLEGALTKLKAKATLEGKPINEELVKELFSETTFTNLKNTSTKKLPIEKIKKVVCEEFKIEMKQMEGTSRKKQIALARQIAMYLARKLGNFSYSKIASAFNRDDHTTVIHAVHKIEEMRKKNPNLNQIIMELEVRLEEFSQDVDEVIHRSVDKYVDKYVDKS
ncbi:Chromosomal replication initiator protein dnaA [Desulfurobacterium thermolithotrophum DSM 11699]|uniref:Chromosomal replication initiator protein DnaA n=1 Tax=Desulfurobacterium thermolithotrophum (strain DSM 11699 / BSA) TaxID=868864 RepID=F0S065_DESTD|nr:chromosomal replication initiator protein DnaA [Desulfurobacterium thermolithotrophum]ADY72663.1 Chromosomal replication initiator protein dnaA [Desulfurobacterium thermolithotrophum DSM 11699]